MQFSRHVFLLVLWLLAVVLPLVLLLLRLGDSIGNDVFDGGGGVAIGGVVVVDRGVVTIGVGNAIFLAFVSFSRCRNKK